MTVNNFWVEGHGIAIRPQRLQSIDNGFGAHCVPIPSITTQTERAGFRSLPLKPTGLHHRVTHSSSAISAVFFCANPIIKLLHCFTFRNNKPAAHLNHELIKPQAPSFPDRLPGTSAPPLRHHHGGGVRPFSAGACSGKRRHHQGMGLSR